MKFKAFAFDLDGTLVDSKIDFAGICKDLNLPYGAEILKELALLDEPERQKAQGIIHEYEQRGADDSIVIDHALDFLKHLESSQIPFAVFTRNSRKTALKTIEKHRLNIPFMISRDDAAPKPHPAGLHIIAERLSVKPQELLFVGDFIYDLQAGLAAGVPTALYLPTAADFETDGAYFTFDHYEKLKSHCFG